MNHWNEGWAVFTRFFQHIPLHLNHFSVNHHFPFSMFCAHLRFWCYKNNHQRSCWGRVQTIH